MTTNSETACRWCSEPLADDHTGPCPKCGKVGRNVTVKLQPGFIKLTGNKVRTITERRQEILKENHKIKWITNGVSIASIFLGGLFPPPFSIIIGLMAFLITNRLAPFAIYKIITIERDKS